MPVAEIENIILLPAVSRAIAESEGHSGNELENKLTELQNAVFGDASAAAIDRVVTLYCRRRIDRLLKKADLSAAADVAGITAEYTQKTAEIDVAGIARKAKERIDRAIRDRNLALFLANYDNKGLLALAARHLKRQQLQDFKNWLTRILRGDKTPAVAAAIRNVLPTVTAR